MLVRVIVDYVSHLGPRGTEVDVPERGAKLLILAGRVEEVAAAQAAAPAEPKRPKYKRRDFKPRVSDPDVEPPRAV